MIKDNLTIRTDLVSEVELLLEFIRKHINKGYFITGEAQRQELGRDPPAVPARAQPTPNTDTPNPKENQMQINLHNDIVFKWIFGRQEHTVPLISLLNAATGIPEIFRCTYTQSL